jgi:stearoyl-CoA desaturase (delta-9 desaturase)
MDDRKEDSLAFAPDLAKDPLVAWQHRHYAVIAITMGFLLPLFVGWLFGVPMGGLLFCGFLRIVASNHCTFLINSLAHTLGSRPYSDSQTARDSWIMAFLACGEGYHNFHHAFAADYRNGIHWYHWDPTKWWIRGVSFLGLASRLKVVPMPDILRARMQNDYSVLVKKGIPVDHLQNIKKQFEEAHDRFRRLGAEYNRVKRNMKEKSHERFVSIRAEFRVAKSDLKTAWSRWSFYTKNFRVILLR